MSVEQNPLGGGIDRETTSPTGRFPTRYDLLLAVLPLPLLLGMLGAHFLAVPVALGAGIGGLPSALLLGYSLFVASPSGSIRSARRRR